MIESCQMRGKVCQVRGCTKVCRCVEWVRRRYGNTAPLWNNSVTVAHQVARFTVGNVPGVTATRFRHVGGIWLGGMMA